MQRLNSVKNQINELINKKQLKTNPKIIAITKTFSINEIAPLIQIGHIHFGENKIQEAEEKWINEKHKHKNLQLHMVGKLQTNKAKKAVKLFDYIHSLDNAKLADKICQYQKELNKKIKIFIQLNVGEETQKSGILLKDLMNFHNYCIKDLSLNIVGLMCLPPTNTETKKYFEMLNDAGKKLNLPELSMGMSTDYQQAVLCGSTYLRLGTVIFGERNI